MFLKLIQKALQVEGSVSLCSSTVCIAIHICRSQNEKIENRANQSASLAVLCRCCICFLLLMNKMTTISDLKQTTLIILHFLAVQSPGLALLAFCLWAPLGSKQVLVGLHPHLEV